MVKAGKHTLTLATRYSPIATSNVRRTEMRRSVPSEVYVRCEHSKSIESPALKTIRADFCMKYKSKLEENKSQQKLENPETETKELRTLYRKLKGVIPALSETQSKPVSSLDVVLSAIDYIRDLHTMLGEKFPSPVDGLPHMTSTPLPLITSSRPPLTQLENKMQTCDLFNESAFSDEDLPSL